MAKTKILTLKEALQNAPGKKHLLTGNGFSMAYDNQRFSYQALFNLASSSLPDDVQEVFKALEISDFEVVMRMYRDASKLLMTYGNHALLAGQFSKNAELIREALARAVSASHPDRPNDISAKRYAACRRFLNNFNDIYTLNYDLLLYWAMMQDVAPSLNHDDGFRTPVDGVAQYVTWDVQNTDKQNLHYLHGALHVFDAEHEVQKYTWCNTGEALIDQIRNALASNKFPIFVSEGKSHEKYAKIQHSSYLGRSYRSFAKITGSLFIYGHSLAANDEHILRLIESGKLKAVFVSVFGDPSTGANREIITRAMRFKAGGVKEREVHFFDAQSAKVWGS